jgi:hypothetical protein
MLPGDTRTNSIPTALVSVGSCAATGDVAPPEAYERSTIAAARRTAVVTAAP